MFNRKIFLFLIVLTIFSSCREDETLKPADSENSILAENTIITTESSQSHLVLADSSTLVFSKGSNQIENVQTGDILVSDISNNAPNGYLRKVVGIEEVGDEIVFITEQAKLTDAIIEDHVDFSYSITADDIIDLDTSGIDVTERGSELVFSFDKVLYDADEDHSTDYDQIKVDGEFIMELNPRFTYDIEGRELQNLQFEINIDNDYSLDLTAGGQIDEITSDELILASFSLGPLAIPAAVPLPFAKQWIIIVLDASGELKVELETGLECDVAGKIGISYNNDSGWDDINEIYSNCDFMAPTLGGEASARADLQFRYEVRPYGLRNSRVFAGVKAYLKAEITPELFNPVIPWELKWGVDLLAKAQMQLFNTSVLNYDIGTNLFEGVIAQGEILDLNFIDIRDGEEYQTIYVDGVRWFAEDLRFQGGFYDYGESNGICPAGWHKATESEWNDLFEFAQTNYSSIYSLGSLCNGNNEMNFNLNPIGNSWWVTLDNGDGTSQQFGGWGNGQTNLYWTGDNNILQISCDDNISFYTNSIIGADGLKCRCVKD